MYGVTFNSIHSGTIEGLMYISSNPFVIPESKDQYVVLPFKDSSYLIPDGSQQDIEVTVNFTLAASSFAELFLRFIQVQNWLHTDKRETLMFDDIPTHYFKAKVVGSVKLRQVEEFDSIGDLAITFRCEPNIHEVIS